MAAATSQLPLRLREADDTSHDDNGADIDNADIISLASGCETEDTYTTEREKEREDDVISLSSDTSEKTTVEDLIDMDIEPRVTLSSVTTLLEVLQSTLQLLPVLQDAADDEVTNLAFARCAALLANVQELERVVGQYVEHARPGTRDVTLDPAAYKWTNDCMLAALGLQADVQRLIEQVEEEMGLDGDAATVDSFVMAEADDGEIVVTLHRHLGPLETWNDTLEAFLPILRCDINEHVATILAFPPETSWDAPNYNCGERSYPSGERYSDSYGPTLVPSTNYTRLRSELYELKDAIKELTSRVVSLTANASEIPRSTHDAARQTGQNVADHLSELLSNNGSDWLESAINGHMGFAEFRALDRHQLRALRATTRDAVLGIIMGERSGNLKVETERFVDSLVTLARVLKMPVEKEPARPWREQEKAAEDRDPVEQEALPEPVVSTEPTVTAQSLIAAKPVFIRDW